MTGRDHGPSGRLTINGRSYGPVSRPVVVICVDGSAPDYHRAAMRAGRMPFWTRLADGPGELRSARCAMPSFTNPNNVSIATGVPPAAHGICGNYFLDPDSGDAVMMDDPGLLRTPTIFTAYADRGARVMIVTAKDKLRRLLGAGLPESCCVSAEKADAHLRHRLERPVPAVYSPELSEFALAAGVDVFTRRRPDLTYVSLSDYVQHKHPPGSDAANDFYAMLDGYCAAFDRLGATLVVTADHGMNAKSAPDGSPRVIYLQELLDAHLGPGAARVILPITDPYTAHHGALGSFATVYVHDGGRETVEATLRHEGLSMVLTSSEACRRFELPADRIGDVVVVADRHTTLGTRRDEHDLSGLEEPLRSHGGCTEQEVPFVVNRRVRGLPSDHSLRNYDAYWIALNFLTAP